jgi:3-oxoacyl-[acyl-carrier protein] reductase
MRQLRRTDVRTSYRKGCVGHGAANGVGRAMSLRCVTEGAAVLCVDIDEEALTKTTLRIEKSGGHTEAQVADVSQENAVEKALHKASEQHKASEYFSKIDVVMNNAAIGRANADWQRIIFVNLEGVYYDLKYGALLLSEQGGALSLILRPWAHSLRWGTIASRQTAVRYHQAHSHM